MPYHMISVLFERAHPFQGSCGGGGVFLGFSNVPECSNVHSVDVRAGLIQQEQDTNGGQRILDLLEASGRLYCRCPQLSLLSRSFSALCVPGSGVLLCQPAAVGCFSFLYLRHQVLRAWHTVGAHGPGTQWELLRSSGACCLES